MKNIKLNYSYSLILALFLLFVSCEDGFLERLPKDQISAELFFRSPKQLEMYMNSFYTSFNDGANYSYHLFEREIFSDNLVSEYKLPDRLSGERTVPSTGGGWNFDQIRRVNYFFENYQKIEDTDVNWNEYKTYVGEAHFFRAFLYFELVKKFGDVPYYDESLRQDSEALYDPKSPRKRVIDNIIDDLEKAVEYLNSGPQSGGNRLNKEIAQLFLSRVCLYEGTWEKYHQGSIFGVPDPKPDEYFEKAANAALSLINSGVYTLYSTGSHELDFFNLFNQTDYSGNQEVMFWKKYDYGQGIFHYRQEFFQGIRGSGIGVTKSLIDDFLCFDGLPTALSPLYQGDSTLTDVMINRDSRLNQSVYEPGDLIRRNNDGSSLIFERSQLWRSGEHKSPTGYELMKGLAPILYDSPEGRTTGTIFFRYAEALLNYAEARAELGIISQTDIDMTINKLRDRVGMPHLNLSNIAHDPDWLFPDLSPIINEVRRERRVELAFEDFRWNDLARWKAADKLIAGVKPLGARFDPIMYPEMVNEIVLNENGYIVIYAKWQPNGLGFNVNRDYLDPIPLIELTLNENLVQNPGWE